MYYYPNISHLPFFPIKALQTPGSALERLRALSCVEGLQEGGENTRRFLYLENPSGVHQLQPHLQGSFGVVGDAASTLPTLAKSLSSEAPFVFMYNRRMSTF